jgi:predicted N-formylglutamate amidohydrolase
MAADQPPFSVIPGAPDTRVLIICDHASRHVPPEYDNLGLEETLLYRHIAWDIGAADVARRLAQILDAPAVLCGTSRLVIDCNRHPGDVSSIPEVSDGIPIPANQGIGDDERRRREDRFFRPYHAEIRRHLDAFAARGQVPAIVAVHSFTPVMNGFERPWHVGLLWDKDDRMARGMVQELRRDATLEVGENQPYTGWEPRSYALYAYGEDVGNPLCAIEIRQDLIDTHHGAEAWAHALAAALHPVLADEALYRVVKF